MKRLITGAVLFSLAFGLMAGIALTPSGPVRAALLPQCIEEPEAFFWVGPKDNELCPNQPLPTGEEWLPTYLCEGYWSNTGQPCMCTFVGCSISSRPTGKTPNHD